jgi:uncharacterized protein (TIGR03435 family)
MMPVLRRCCVLLLVSSAGVAQTLTFEVASIKPAPPLTPELMRSGQLHIGVKIDKARADFGGIALTDLIARAYKVKSYQVTGPEWMKSRFDILAKMPDGATEDQVPDMLKALLEERFKLKVHVDSKEFPVYALVVGKNGPKLTPQPADYDPKKPGPTRAMTVESFAQIVGNGLDRPVVDQTEIKGQYMFSIDVLMQSMMNRVRNMAQQQAARNNSGPPADAATDPTDSSAFTAAQSYGLKLEPRKLNLPFVMVDHLEKDPTEN